MTKLDGIDVQIYQRRTVFPDQYKIMHPIKADKIPMQSFTLKYGMLLI